MGGGRFVAVGDLAAPMAALDGRRAPDRREPWDNAGRVGELPVGWLPLPPRVPGWRAAGVAGALDSPLSPRARGMAAGEAAVRQRSTGFPGPFPRPRPPDHDADAPGLRARVNG